MKQKRYYSTELRDRYLQVFGQIKGPIRLRDLILWAGDQRTPQTYNSAVCMLNSLIDYGAVERVQFGYYALTDDGRKMLQEEGFACGELSQV